MRDSWLRHCGKLMWIDECEDEGQALLTHHCSFCETTRTASAQRPAESGSSFLADLRERYWREVAP